MNTITIIEPATIAPTFDSWVDTGRNLASRRRDVDWEIADWMLDGQSQGFLDQTSFDFLADNLGIAPKRLRDISKAATAFPSHLRDKALTIEHHAAVAPLPKQEAMELLHVAKDKHWTPERVRNEARLLSEKHAPVERDDDSLLISFIRHWNCLPRNVRMEAAEMIAASHGDEIEP
ncbi:hypothetical protein [Sphingobium sp. CFD-1]|uniref:hypothetical protein n=1 Tax=Sphingobium sp. CFD-1 TaxID=2878545 RepID=UPI00214B5888|nr:hypothetical protein [Sphingobium sp. CFD-1]